LCEMGGGKEKRKVQKGKESLVCRLALLYLLYYLIEYVHCEPQFSSIICLSLQHTHPIYT
jgi:hypothetical protein